MASNFITFYPDRKPAYLSPLRAAGCIFCGYCEDACPTDAIVLAGEYELADYDRRSLIYTKEQLLVPPPPGSARQAIRPEGLVSEP